MSANQMGHQRQPGVGASIARSLQLAVMRAPGVSIERAAQRGRAIAPPPPERRPAPVSYVAWAEAAA